MKLRPVVGEEFNLRSVHPSIVLRRDKVRILAARPMVRVYVYTAFREMGSRLIASKRVRFIAIGSHKVVGNSSSLNALSSSAQLKGYT